MSNDVDEVSVVTQTTDFEIRGPWLLDSSSLIQLDEILDEHWDRLEAHETSSVELRIGRHEKSRGERMRKFEEDRVQRLRRREVTVQLGQNKTARTSFRARNPRSCS